MVIHTSEEGRLRYVLVVAIIGAIDQPLLSTFSVEGIAYIAAPLRLQGPAHLLRREACHMCRKTSLCFEDNLAAFSVVDWSTIIQKRLDVIEGIMFYVS